MLEPTNTSESSSRVSTASADRSTGQNRSFGLAALAASRKVKEGGTALLARVTTKLSRSNAKQQPPDEPVPPTSTLRSVSDRADRVQLGLATISASRRAAAGRANRVQNGQSLSALRDTSTGVQQFSSGLLQSDGGRRSTSLFDLPSSGQGLVLRLRGQVRPSSPLNALRARGAGGTQSSGGLSSLSALNRANAQLAGLRTAFTANDNGSRLLLSASSSSRPAGGFGLAATSRSAFDLIG
jgi:hypothetical protein